MGILDELDDLKGQHKRPCYLALFLDTLDIDDRRDVEVALADSQYSSRSIHVVLQTRGWKHVETVVSRHRRGDCCCGNI